MTRKAIVNSTQPKVEDVEILEYKDNNHVIARFNGKTCTAVFNPFTGYFYVDDIYGVLEGGDRA